MDKMKILLCVGGMVYGEHAAGFVAQLGGGMGIDCTVLYINPVASTFRGQKFPTPKSKKDIDEFMDKVMAILKNKGIEDIKTIIRDGEPVKEILNESDKGYNMIVTGTRGARGLERHLFESVASHVAEYAKIPVLVVRNEALRYNKALVATDGSEASKEALYCCGFLARSLGFDVNVLSVARDPTEKDCAEEAVTEAVTVLEQKFNILAKGKVLEGNPAEIILDESKGNDLIVLGARGLSWIKRLLMGHVSQKVLTDEETNVLIVRNCEFYTRKND